MKIRRRSLLLAAIFLLALCVAGSWYIYARPSAEGTVSVRDLRGSSVYIRHVSRRQEKLRLVEDPRWIDLLTRLCSGTRPFRPVNSTFAPLPPLDPFSVYFFKGNVFYTFQVFDFENQIDIYNPNRDRPLLLCSKTTVWTGGSRPSVDTEWSWYVSIDAAGYMKLLGISLLLSSSDDFTDLPTLIDEMMPD